MSNESITLTHPINSLKITACPEGGFMVYGFAEEERAFVHGKSIIPLAAFASLRLALEFVSRKMDPDEAPSPIAADRPANEPPVACQETIQWYSPLQIPQHMRRILIAIEDDWTQTNRSGYFDGIKSAWCQSDQQIIPPGSVKAWAFMPAFPRVFVRALESN